MHLHTSIFPFICHLDVSYLKNKSEVLRLQHITYYFVDLKKVKINVTNDKISQCHIEGKQSTYKVFWNVLHVSS